MVIKCHSDILILCTEQMMVMNRTLHNRLFSIDITENVRLVNKCQLLYFTFVCAWLCSLVDSFNPFEFHSNKARGYYKN